MKEGINNKAYCINKKVRMEKFERIKTGFQLRFSKTC